jgi:hypothetical protein
MILALALAAALFQAPDTLPVYDSPATRALVQRAIAASRELPADLQDYRAKVQSSLFVTISPDSAAGGDLPASVDEVVSTVQWERGGGLHQEVIGHRARLLLPMPYTLATIFERPWVIPHLYGSSLFTPFTGPRAVSPFGARGPEFYRYLAEDTVRITVQGQTVTLLPVSVRPRVAPTAEAPLLVLGTFYLDTERAAVARARFGFIGNDGSLPPSLGRLETFLELDNALWHGRYWLPFQQRREVLFNSKLLGGAVAARVINRFTEMEFNTGWKPAGDRVTLTWAQQTNAFAEWRGDVGSDAGDYSTRDFDDLRIATETADPRGQGLRVQLHYERANHLFRYNRVEGAFLGVGGRLTPPDPRRERWQLYGTAGWALAESTARGEVGASWGQAVAPSGRAGIDYGAQAAVYRRLHDIQPFRPTYNWDLVYTLPALLWGSDRRDYYDATGAEAAATFSRDRWSGRLGGRVERWDSVRVNTQSFLFGKATEFGPLAGVDVGTHAALEGGAGYALGPGAFGMGNSAIVHGDAEVGLADFRFTRVVGLVSLRYGLGPFTFATRVDGGQAWGQVPPQKLFRFGSAEGLRGYEPNEFGGSTAVLARARFLTALPPRSAQPLARVGWFLVPPLRPALVLVQEMGYTRVESGLGDELARLFARPTDGVRNSVGVGLSILDDALTAEYLVPVGANSRDRPGRWYVGLAFWY